MRVLPPQRPVKAEVVVDAIDRVWSRIAASYAARNRLWRANEEHPVDGDRHHDHDDQSEKNAANEKTDHGYFPKILSLRGSNASRTPSPKMLKARVVTSSAKEGKNRYHHAT